MFLAGAFFPPGRPQASPEDVAAQFVEELNRDMSRSAFKKKVQPNHAIEASGNLEDGISTLGATGTPGEL